MDHGAMTVRMAGLGAVELAYETFGVPDDPPLVLVMGLGSQMIAWPEGFCAGLAGEGFHVVRFDNRDVGLSTHFQEAGMPDLAPLLSGGLLADAPYTLADMASDTIGLLDALGIDRAHVVGASMGGMIAQEMAIRHPARLRSLTSIFSSPSPLIGAATPEAAAALLLPPARTAEENGQRTLQILRIIGSPGYPLDEEQVVARGEVSFRRGDDPAGVYRQLAAIHASGDRTERLGGVDVRTLVIHGEADVLVRPEGGAATAAAIRGARLVTYPGMGHDLPSGLWTSVIGEVATHAHTADEG
jgi:pimeloyl-ACP methyl ester carboxylesterase